MVDWEGPLTEAFERATTYLTGLPERRVGPRATAAELHEALGGPLPTGPSDPRDVVAHLAKGVEDGLLPSGSGRFFGFVFGGATPAALAADWLTTVWDQNAGLYAAAPAAAVVEEVAANWLVELFGLPSVTSVGFVTGAQMANFTGLAAARHEVLRRAGWDVERDGLIGAPPSACSPAPSGTTRSTGRCASSGLGTSCIVPIDCRRSGQDAGGRTGRALRKQKAPQIVCAQAGNVNTGAFDPIGEICDLAHAAGAWVHVDGAFGLWAAVSPTLPHTGRRHRPRRLLGDRRAQVAERARTTPASSSARIRSRTAPRCRSERRT